MSKSSSGSRKTSSLAKSYDYFNNKKRNKKYAANTSISKSAVAGVMEKIEEAVQKDESSLAAPTQPPGSINGNSAQQVDGAQQVDAITGQPACPRDPGAVESQIGAVTDTSVASMTEVEKKGLATSLIDADQLWYDFFSGLTDDALDAVEEEVREMQLEYTHSKEIAQAAKRGERRFSDICNLPLKLILTPLRHRRKVANVFASLLEMRFGPLHVALQVGNVVLEWNDSSLVTPHLCAYEDQVMELDIQPHSEWVEYTTRQHPEMRKAAQELDYSEQIELAYKVSAEKKILIDALIDLIIEYNKHYYYNLFDRNCQHFVLDALRVLKVRIPKELPGGLGEYYKTLIKGKTPSIPAEFRIHSELDEYVMRQTREGAIDSMSQHDLEFLLALYFRFHLESRAKLNDRPALEAWQCGELQCCMREVEKRIQVESMKIHSFKCPLSEPAV